MKVSRRGLLQSAAAALPVLKMRVEEDARVEILAEGHCLSAESARGFRNALGGMQRPMVVAAGMRDLCSKQAMALKARVGAGERLVFESAPEYSAEQVQCLADEFQIRVQRSGGRAEWNGEYVEYQWPVRKLVRPFLAAVTVQGREWTPLATMRGGVCAAQKRFGLGKMIFLGSMIGPGLLADEREAHEVMAALAGC